MFGAHAFWLHPWFVALAWWKLYGFPFDLRLWVAFIIHDIGYWGKSDMDGKDGETHPLLGAHIMRKLFGNMWGDFTLYHSRWYAHLANEPYSRLCVADKYALCLTPAIIYIPMVSLTGEIKEYMAIRKESKADGTHNHTNKWVWLKAVKAYVHNWVILHKNCIARDEGFDHDSTGSNSESTATGSSV